MGNFTIPGKIAQPLMPIENRKIFPWRKLQA